jgi:hypothetical protein
VMLYFEVLGLTLGLKKKDENPGKPENLTN